MSAKPWYQSATIYALMVSITAQLLHLLGLGDDIANATAIKFVEGALPLVGIFADAFAAWGRARAQGPVTLTQGGAVTKSSQGGFASVWMLTVIVAVSFSALVITGCAMAEPGPKRALIETSVRIAVRHTVADSPRAAQKAQNIRNAVLHLQSTVTSVSTVAGIKSKVAEELDKLSLLPVDRADIDELFDLLAVVFEPQIEALVIDGDQYVPIEQFLQLVLNSIPATTA